MHTFAEELHTFAEEIEVQESIAKSATLHLYAPDVVPKLPIPFSPNIPVGKAADLIQTSAVPRLCQELDLPDMFPSKK